MIGSEFDEYVKVRGTIIKITVFDVLVLVDATPLFISAQIPGATVLARPVACRAACHIATKTWPAILTMAMALLYLVSWCGNKAKKCILPSLGDKRCNMGLNNVLVVM